MAISLVRVSNDELVGRLKQFVRREKELTHRIVLHLAELNRRRLYAELGFTSLFDYCTRGLDYTPTSAQRRIKAARAIECIPEVYDCLENGTLSLGVIEIVADALTGPKGREIVKDICGKSKDEARRVLAAYRPVGPEMLKDCIEPIVVLKSIPSNNNVRAEQPQSEMENDLEEGFRVSFSASAELMDKLEYARELAFGGFGSQELGPIFEQIVDDYIERHCPRAKSRRRQEREERKGDRLLGAIDTVQEASNAIAASMDEDERDPRRSRYVSDALRAQIFERDGYCCTYVAPDGTKCECRTELQVDHIAPFAQGGLTEAENLRTACRTHNHWLARRVYGDEYIDQIIARRRPGRDGRPTVSPEPSEYIDPWVEQLVFE